MEEVLLPEQLLLPLIFPDFIQDSHMWYTNWQVITWPY